jgi:hypothetical protein
MLEFERLIEAVSNAIRVGTQAELDALTKEFNTPVMNIVKTQWITSNCADIIFINYTPLAVTVNGNIQVNNYILQPGGFVSISGNNGELNVDTYNVVFDPLATNCAIIKRLYVRK